MDSQLPTELEGQSIQILGKVESTVKSDGDYRRFLFRVKTASIYGDNRSPDGCDTRCRQLRALTGKRVRLSWKTDAQVNTRNTISFVVRLKRPRGFVNFDGFDYQAWLLAQNISATGYVKKRIAESHANAPSPPATMTTLKGYSLYHLRENLLGKLSVATQGLAHAGVIRALASGDDSGIKTETWDIFRNTGTVHLIAISGLHVGMVAGFSMLILSWVLRPLSLICHPQIVRLCLFSGSALMAFLYAYLAGFSIPTRRAFLLIVLIQIALYIGRKTSFIQLLMMVACALLLANPYAVTQPGFMLSFSAVAILIYVFSQRIDHAPTFHRFVKAQGLMAIALIPLLAMFHLPIAALSPVANFFAIPAISFAILPLILIGALVCIANVNAASFIFSGTDGLLNVLFSFLNILSDTSTGFILPAENAVLVSCLCAVPVLLLLLPASLGLRLASFVLMSFFFVSIYFKPSRHTLSILDVGQGLSVVINLNKHTLVYDVGARYSDSFDIATSVLLPHLYANNRSKIDTLILSHADNDHAGAHEKLFNRIPIDNYFSGEVEKLRLKASAAHLWTDANRCYRGQHLSVQSPKGGQMDVNVDVLWPPRRLSVLPKSSRLSSNDQSCVLLIRIASYTILLAGDISKKVEKELLRLGQLPQDLDVLIAPHHGSGSSSSQAFVEHLSPRHVVVSAGYKNRYRHPAKPVLARYEQTQTSIWNTAVHGAIRFTWTANGEQVESARCHRNMPWYGNEPFCEPL